MNFSAQNLEEKVATEHLSVLGKPWYCGNPFTPVLKFPPLFFSFWVTIVNHKLPCNSVKLQTRLTYLVGAGLPLLLVVSVLVFASGGDSRP
ncbi:hypothetical protein LC605_25110 [Nostoc sp. CHAB 5836]|nr:hypothetical protein [Nostoc sp. CHAB 5836]